MKKSTRNRKYWQKNKRTRTKGSWAKTIRDFNFIVNDDSFPHGFGGHNGFSGIRLQTTSQEVRDDLERVFTDLRSGIHYWVDTAVILTRNLCVGTFSEDGKEYKILDRSFLSAATAGLDRVYPPCSRLFRDYKEIKRIERENLEELLSSGMVSIPPAILVEIERGRSNTISRYSTVVTERYKTVLCWAINDAERVIKSAKKGDQVIDKLLRVGKQQEMLGYCKSVAGANGIGTSDADHSLVAYALANAVNSVGETQAVFTRDTGIISLVNACKKDPPYGVALMTKVDCLNFRKFSIKISAQYNNSPGRI